MFLSQDFIPRPTRLARITRVAVSKILLWFYVKPLLLTHVGSRYSGLKLQVPSTVFHPSLYFSSRYFASVLESSVAFAGKRVLDIGCGSGILSLVAAGAGAHVVAVDINAEAVECTRINAELNMLASRVSAIESDLFEALSPAERFDCIVTNPPFFIRQPQTIAQRAWSSSPAKPFLEILAQRARDYLKPDGCVYCIFSSDADVAKLVELFRRYGFDDRVLSSKRFLFERMYVFRFSCLSPTH